jgi:hypothetical protein
MYFYRIDKEFIEYEQAQIYLQKIDSINKSKPTINKFKKELPPHEKELPLLQQRIREWKRASREDKIGACKSFVEEFNKISPRDLTAIDVMNCVDKATKGLSATDDLLLSEVITLCSQEILK